jgi:hypothetical protein
MADVYAPTPTFSYFTHPNAVCMSYMSHAKLSLTLCYKLFRGSVKAFIHAILPNFYVTGTSDTVYEISNILERSGCVSKTS